MKRRSRQTPCVKTGAHVILTKVHLNRDVLKRAQRMGWILPSHNSTDKNNNNNNNETVLPSRYLNGKHKREYHTKLGENVLSPSPSLREDSGGLLQPESRQKVHCKVRRISEERPLTSSMDKASMAKHNEAHFNGMNGGKATQECVQSFKETTRVACDDSGTEDLGDNSEGFIGGAYMEDDYSMFVCNEEIFCSEDEGDKPEYETFQTKYVPVNDETTPRANTEERASADDKEKSSCQVQTSSNEQDQQKRTNLQSNKKKLISSMDGSDKEEGILSWLENEGKKVDNEKFQLMLKDAVVRSVFTSAEAEKEQSKIYGLKKKLALLEIQNRELHEVTMKLQSRMSQLEKEVDKKATHGTQVDLDTVLQRSSNSETDPSAVAITEVLISGTNNNAATPPISLCKRSDQIGTSIASKRQFLQRTESQTLERTTWQTSSSISQEQRDDHIEKSHEPLIVVKKEPPDNTECDSSSFAGNGTTSITDNTFTSCANNHKAPLSPRHRPDVVPFTAPVSNAIPPNTFHSIQYLQYPPQTQTGIGHYQYPQSAAVQASQPQIQVPMLPGYTFPNEESRVRALRSYMYAAWLAQQQWQLPPPQYPQNGYRCENTPSSDFRFNTLEQTPVEVTQPAKRPAKASAEILDNTTMMNLFLPNDDLTQLQQNRHSYLWMRRKFPHYVRSLLEQRQQQQQQQQPHQYLQQQQQQQQQHLPMQQQHPPVQQKQQQHPPMQQEQEQQHPPMQQEQQHPPMQQKQPQHPPMQQQQQHPPVQQKQQQRHPQTQQQQQQHPPLQQQQQQHPPLLPKQQQQHPPMQQQQQHPPMQQQQQQQYPPMQQQQQQQQQKQNLNIPKQKHLQQEPKGHLQLLQNLTEAIQRRQQEQRRQHQGPSTTVQTPECDAFSSSPNNIITTISSIVAKDTADAVPLGVDNSNPIYIQDPQPNLSMPCATVEKEKDGKRGQQRFSLKRSTNVMLLTPPTTPSSFLPSGGNENRDISADTNSIKTTVASSTKDATISLKVNDVDSQKIDSILNKVALKPQWKTTPHLSLPPQPSVSVALAQGNVVMTWSMTKVSLTPIAKYELYSYLVEDRARNAGDPWRHVGTLTAIPLPMACSFTEFEPGMTYYFAVRAVDIYGCKGKLSPPCKVTITID